MNYKHEDQQRQQQLLTVVDRGNAEQVFTFLQRFHREPFQDLAECMTYTGVIDDEIDFIDCTGTKYNVTPLIIAAGKGSYEKTKILLVHGANPNKQCATGDTALNLAAHRQKYPIVDLLLQYHANPNIYNQSGKTALHRAVVSYNDEYADQIRLLLDAGADPNIEDRNQRIPLDEAVVANRPEIVDVLLSHDRSLVERAYRASISAARLGHDKCLETLLNYGMDPNITDRTNTTPLHVAVRSLKLSTVRLLVANGADQNIANNRGETALSIAEYLQPDQQQNFLNVLVLSAPNEILNRKNLSSISLTNTNSTTRKLPNGDASQIALSDFHTYPPANAIPYIHPLLRSHPNWTLDSDEFRSRTDQNSTVENLLNTSSGTYWCCTQSKNAWVIFDLKHQYNITGIRIIGCDNRSTPKTGHVDVSNAFNGPWLRVSDFSCLLSQTRFIRVFILDNYGGDDIRIQGIGFFGVDMRLVNLLREYQLEKSLNTLLANGINDQETLNENLDEILNLSDKYLHVNDHFQFIRLTESLRPPQLTFLEWFNPPQTTVIAGEKLQMFSAAGDEGVTDRVKLEEKPENSPQATTVLMRDLEPIQGRSLVDFPDYTIKYPGRYKIRVVSVESPDIQTPWQEIIVGPTLSSASKLNAAAEEHLYLSSTTCLYNVTTSDKENTSLSQTKPTTAISNKENRAFITKVYESENDDTEDDTYLTSLKSIEDSPYYFSPTKMLTATKSPYSNYNKEQNWTPDHKTQTPVVDNYDHSTNTDGDDDDDIDVRGRSRSVSKRKDDRCLTPTRYRVAKDKRNFNNQEESNNEIPDASGDKIIIPTKYRLEKERELFNNRGNVNHQHQQSHNGSHQQSPHQRSQQQTPARSGSEEQTHKHSSYQQQKKFEEEEEEPRHQSNGHHQQGSTYQKRPQQSPTRSGSEEQTHKHSSYQQQKSQQKKFEEEEEPSHQSNRHRQQEPIYDRSQVQHPQTGPIAEDEQQQSTYKHPYETSRKRKESDNEAPPRQQQPSRHQTEDDKLHEQHHQDHTTPIYNQFKIISGDFEFQEQLSDDNSDNNEPKSKQMQLVLKATVQGSEPQKRATNNINQNRPLSSFNSSNQDNINATSGQHRPGEPFIRNDQRQSGSNRTSMQKPTSNDVPSSRKTTINDEENSPTKSTHQPSASKHLAPGNSSTANTNRYEDKDADQYSHSSQYYGTANDDKNHLKHSNDGHDLLIEPSLQTASGKKGTYYFGKLPENQVTDEENDEVECESFGHNSQPRPVTNTTTTSSLNNPVNDNKYTGNREFVQATDIGTTTGTPNLYSRPRSSITNAQQQPHLSSINQSTTERNRDSQRDAQAFNSDDQARNSYYEKIDDNLPMNDRNSTHLSNVPSNYAQNYSSSQYPTNPNYHVPNTTASRKPISDQESNDEHNGTNEDDEVDDDDDKDDAVDVEEHDPEDDENDNNEHIYRNETMDDDDDNANTRDDESTQRSSTRASELTAIVTQNPVHDTSGNSRPPPTYSDTESQTQKKKKGGFLGLFSKSKTDGDKKTKKSSTQKSSSSKPTSSSAKVPKRGKNPFEVATRTTDAPYLYTFSIIPPRPHSTPTTDITDEITEREPFDKPHAFRHTPDLYLSDSRNSKEDDEEDSDQMSGRREHNRKRERETKPKHRSTQSEEKTTRNVGTMAELIKTGNFGNEIQLQTSATQTLHRRQSPSSSIPHRLPSSTHDRSPSPNSPYRSSIPHRTPSPPTHHRPYQPQRSRSPSSTRQYVLSSTTQRHPTSSSPQHRRPQSPSQKDRSSYIIQSRTPSPPTQHRPQQSPQPRSPSSTRQYVLTTTTQRRPTSPPPQQKHPPSYIPNRTPSPPAQHRPHQSPEPRSPPRSRKNTSPYSQNRKPSSPPQYRHPPSHIRSRTPSPPTQHRPPQSPQPRSPSSTRQYVLTSTTQRHPTSPPPKNRTHKTKDRPPTSTVETDTSRDGMKNSQHIGVQYEPLPTRDYGTITTAEIKKQHQTNHSTNFNTTPSYLQHQESSSSLSNPQDYFLTSPPPPHQQQKQTFLQNDPSPSTQKNYVLRPTRNDVYVADYKKPPSKHIKPITPDPIRRDEHTTWYEPEPIIVDHRKPTKPIRKQQPDYHEQQVDVAIYEKIPEDSYISKLPRGGSISIPPTTVIQPDTLPRSHIYHPLPPRHDYDEFRNKKKIIDIPIHYGQQQRRRSITASPVLNIGTENIIRQSQHEEFTTPLPDTHYIQEPNRDFTTSNNNHSSPLRSADLRSRNNPTLLLRAINSARTYVFETLPFSANNIYQSPANGNFSFKRASSLRSLNSGQYNDSGYDPSTPRTDNFTGYGLRSQVV